MKGRDSVASRLHSSNGKPVVIVLLMGVSGSGKTTIGLAAGQGARVGRSSMAMTSTLEANVAKMAAGAAAHRRRPLAVARPDRGGNAKVLARGEQRVLRMLGAEGGLSPPPATRGRRAHRLPQGRCGHRSARALAARAHRYMPASLLPSQFATLEEPADALVVDIRDPIAAQVQRIRDGLGQGVHDTNR